MGPPPLRDGDHLLGLPGLRDSDQTKVELANQLYRCAIQLLRLCMELGCMVSIENPARSWLWALLAMLVNATDDADFIAWFAELESVYFDACAHGSTRDKRTKLLGTPGLFTSLEACCPQNHTHASWQPYRSEQGIVFPTAAEAEYPALLCRRMANCVQQMAQTMNITPKVSARLKDLLKLNMVNRRWRTHHWCQSINLTSILTYLSLTKLTNCLLLLLLRGQNPLSSNRTAKKHHARGQEQLSNMEFGILRKSFCRRRPKYDIPWTTTWHCTGPPKRPFKKWFILVLQNLPKKDLLQFLKYAECHQI